MCARGSRADSWLVEDYDDYGEWEQYDDDGGFSRKVLGSPLRDALQHSISSYSNPRLSCGLNDEALE